MDLSGYDMLTEFEIKCLTTGYGRSSLRDVRCIELALNETPPESGKCEVCGGGIGGLYQGVTWIRHEADCKYLR